MIEQSRVYSNSVLSDADTLEACDSEIGELSTGKRILSERLDNLRKIEERIKAEISAHKLLLTGLRIKKELLLKKKKKKRNRIDSLTQSGTATSQPRRRTPAGEELWASGGCTLQ